MELLQKLLGALEYGQDSLLVVLYSCIRPLVENLIVDQSFVLLVEKALQLEGLDGVMHHIFECMWASFVGVSKRAAVTSAFMNAAFLEKLFDCQVITLPLYYGKHVCFQQWLRSQ